MTGAPALAGSNHRLGWEVDSCQVSRDKLSTKPFRFLVVDEAFSSPVFDCMKRHVRAVCDSDGEFSSTERDYGARIIGLHHDNLGPLSDLINSAIIRRVAEILNVPTTNYVDAAIHCHPPGSPSGWLHTDFNSGWFACHPDDGLHFSGRDVCDYRTGQSSLAADQIAELTRSIAVILYFSEEWSHQHGGETVICRSAVDVVDDASIRIAPLANRILAFECSPVSFHSFATTTRERMSVIFWTHANASQLADRWPLSLRSGWK